MKNKILAIVCIAALISGLSIKSTYAQRRGGQYFQKGDKVLNFGLGFGSLLYSGTHDMRFPVFSSSLDLGVVDDIGIGNIGAGGYFGISGAKDEWSDGGINYTYFIIGARATYHFVDIADNVDIYGGIMPTYTYISHSHYGNEHNPNTSYGPDPDFSLFGGIRYYVSDNFALMAEAGYGVSFLNLGISLKF